MQSEANLYKDLVNETISTDDMPKLRLELKSLRQRFKKEEEQRKYWQELSKKKDEEIIQIKLNHEEMKISLEKERENAKSK